MAEIKSTLDLVMERTRNLNFSSKEKQEMETEKAGKSFNGLLVKYQDQFLTLEELKREVKKLTQAFPSIGQDKLAKILADKIKLSSLDGPLPELLKHLFNIDGDPMKKLSADYNGELATLSERHRKRLQDQLKEAFQISGSAVVANLEADEAWKNEAASLTENFEEALNREKMRLLERV